MQIGNLALPIVMGGGAQEHEVRGFRRGYHTALDYEPNLRNPSETFGIIVSSSTIREAAHLRQCRHGGILAPLAFAKVRLYMRQYFASPMFWIMRKMF
jgi:hypothetical protein